MATKMVAKTKTEKVNKFPISGTKIDRRLEGKTNSILVSTIIALKKINPEYAKLAALPRRKMIIVNVEQLEKVCKDGDKIIVPGKILGNGMLSKKLRIVALSASEDAREKIKKAKGEFITIEEELKNNKKLNDLKLLKYD